MTIMSLADACRLLAIDPKTLRRWLRLAHLSVQAHPSDTRLKCVTSEQLEHLARMHRRTLLEASEPLVSPAPSALGEVSTASVWSSVASEVSGSMTELVQQLGSLQSQVALLHHQLALLTEHFPKEEQWCIRPIKLSVESSPDTSVESSPDTSVESSPDTSAESSPDTSVESSPDTSAESSPDTSAESSPEKETRLASIDRRKHPHVLPLVEYGAKGTYAVISPEEGLLSFEPDSPAWFAWLSTLPSFRFVGKGGRFTAFRGYQSTAHTSWWAHRQIHNHSQRRRLGLTALVTIECLELAASSLQALVS
jgi:hypothetical protein